MVKSISSSDHKRVERMVSQGTSTPVIKKALDGRLSTGQIAAIRAHCTMGTYTTRCLRVKARREGGIRQLLSSLERNVQELKERLS